MTRTEIIVSRLKKGMWSQDNSRVGRKFKGYLTRPFILQKRKVKPREDKSQKFGDHLGQELD